MYEATGSRYPGSRPFHDDAVDRIIFRGREKEKARLLQLILAEKLVVLYAKSGMGKTSLLNAGVFQALRLKGYFPFALRLNDPEKAPSELIYEEIAGAAQMHGLEFESGHKGALWQYFKTTEFWSKKDVLFTPVLVFDQFEEIFTLGFSETQKKEFFIQLADLVRGTMPKSLKGRPQIPRESPYSDKPPNIKIVISIREDFLGDLEELADDIPTILRNRFRLIPLTQEQAQKAIEEPANLKNKQLQTRRFSYTKRAINTMIKFLSEGRKGKEIVRTDEIELFQLQVLCQHIEKKVITKKLATTKKIRKKQRKRRKIFNLLFQYTQKKILLLKQKTANRNLQMLWRNIEKWLAHKMQKPSSKIRIAPDDFGGLSGMQKIWRNFYDTQIKQFTLGKRRAVRILCETGLISSTGRRLSLEAEMIKEKFKVSTDILSRLIANRLLRVEPRLNGFYYELSHDNLVSPIKRSSKNRKVKTLLEILAGSGLAIAVFIGVNLFNKWQDQAQQAKEKIALAESLLSAYPDSASVVYWDALELNPDEPRIYSGLAIALIKSTKYDSAAYIYRRAVYRNPDFASIYDTLIVELKPDSLKPEAKDAAKEIAKIAAEAYKKDKKWAEAISASKKAIKLDSSDASNYSALAHAYIELKDFDEAISSYQKALNAYIKSTKYDSVANVYKRAVKRNPEFASIYKSLIKKLEPGLSNALAVNAAQEIAKIAGDTYKERKKWKEAISAYQTVLIAMIKLKKYFTVTDFFRTAIASIPEVASIYDSLIVELKADFSKAVAVNAAQEIAKIAADAYKERKKWKEAISAYQKAVELYPHDENTYSALADAFIKLKNDDAVEAGKVYQSYIKTKPKYDFIYDKLIEESKKKNQSEPDELYKIASAAYASLGDTLKAQNNLDEAFRQYNKAVTLDTTNYDAYAGLAYEYRRQMKYEQAVTAFTNALKWVGSGSTKAARLHTSRGLTYWFDVKTDSAKSDFRRAIELNPAYSTPHHHLAGILMAQDSLEKALKLSFKVTDKLASTDTLHWDRLAKIYSRMGNNKKEKTSEAEAKRLRSKQVATKN